jgi:hypothetical protein
VEEWDKEMIQGRSASLRTTGKKEEMTAEPSVHVPEHE